MGRKTLMNIPPPRELTYASRSANPDGALEDFANHCLAAVAAAEVEERSGKETFLDRPEKSTQRSLKPITRLQTKQRSQRFRLYLNDSSTTAATVTALLGQLKSVLLLQVHC